MTKGWYKKLFWTSPAKTPCKTPEKNSRRAAESDESLASSQTEAVENLRRVLSLKYLRSRWPATDVSELSYLIGQCGVPGLDMFALDPLQPSFTANASRKVVLSLGLKRLEEKLCSISVPLASSEGERQWTPLPVNLLHEVLVAEFLSAPTSHIAAALDLNVPNWERHPERIRIEAQGGIAIPWGLFIDGAAWRGKGAGHRDSVINVVTNVIGSKSRRTLLTIRKELLCGLHRKQLQRFANWGQSRGRSKQTHCSKVSSALLRPTVQFLGSNCAVALDVWARNASNLRCRPPRPPTAKLLQTRPGWLAVAYAGAGAAWQ